MGVAKEFLDCTISKFNDIKALGEKTIAQLNREELEWSPSGESNSIAIIVKHLSGNMLSRWTDFLASSDGEKPGRNRDAEFAGGYASKEALLHAWEQGWETLFAATPRKVAGV